MFWALFITSAKVTLPALPQCLYRSAMIMTLRWKHLYTLPIHAHCVFGLICYVAVWCTVLGLRRSDPNLALINSCVETSATLLLIIIRMANAYGGYREVRSTVRHEENFDPDKDIHVRLLKRWMIVFEFIGLILFGFSLGCFLIFYFHVHLGWTILSNNLCLITILVVSTLYRSRVVVVIARIREDQLKVSISIRLSHSIVLCLA